MPLNDDKPVFVKITGNSTLPLNLHIPLLLVTQLFALLKTLIFILIILIHLSILFTLLISKPIQMIRLTVFAISS